MNLARMLGGPLLLLGRLRPPAKQSIASRKETLRALDELGLRSLSLITMSLLFFGTVVISIAYVQARKYTGNITLVGPAYFKLIVRDFTPLIVPLLVAARAGASIAAEVATMKVTEHLDAMTLLGGNLSSEVIVPRLVASLGALPILCLVGTGAAIAAAVVTISAIFGADGHAFLDARHVGAADVACALAKCLCCGLFIPLTACFHGLAARGGTPAVGAAVTAAVVHASIGCLLVDLTLTFAFRWAGL